MSSNRPSSATPATTSQQDDYWYLRGQLTAAIARNWQAVLGASPEIREAARKLDVYVESHSARAFRVVRPEELIANVEAGDRVVLR